MFIDFDGTFADRGQVPAGHVEAVRQARVNGHRILLCTGRPKAMVPHRLLDSVFDGLVAAAGGYVEIGGTILADTRFPTDLAAQVVTVLTSYDVTFILEAPQALYGPVGIREPGLRQSPTRGHTDPDRHPPLGCAGASRQAILRAAA